MERITAALMVVLGMILTFALAPVSSYASWPPLQDIDLEPPSGGGLTAQSMTLKGELGSGIQGCCRMDQAPLIKACPSLLVRRQPLQPITRNNRVIWSPTIPSTAMRTTRAAMETTESPAAKRS